MIDTAVILCHYGRPGRPATLPYVVSEHVKQNTPFLLIVVELVFDGQDVSFEPVEIPFIHIKLDGEDRHRHLFQKESLLNIGIRRIPKHIKYVIVLDADFYSEKMSWFGQARRKLVENPNRVVQMYSSWKDTEMPQMWGTSFAWAQCKGIPNYCSPCSYVRLHNNVMMTNNPGGGWAFTKKKIMDFGLFNTWMVDGRGDAVFVREMFFSGQHPKMRQTGSIYAKYDDIYRRNIGSGLIDYVDIDIRHKNHGNMGWRNYMGRQHAVCLWNRPRNEIVGEDENGLMYWLDPECIERKILGNMMDHKPQCEDIDYIIQQYKDLGYNFYGMEQDISGRQPGISQTA